MSSDVNNWCPPSGVGPQPPPNLNQVVPSDLLETLCYRGMQPLGMTGAILQVLRTQFRQPNTLGEHTLRKKVWTPTFPTEVVIESIYRWRAKDVNTRPALVVKSHGLKFQSVSLNNVIKHDNYQNVYSIRVYGTHTVFAIHSNGEGALWLGMEAALALVETAHPVGMRMRLQDYKVNGTDGIFEIEEARESFACPINISWSYDHVWKLNQESPILKDVNLTPDNVLFNR